MKLTLLKCKLHRATVTESDLEYEGSVSIDSGLMEAAGILPHEQIDVLDITNGARFTTYAIKAAKGSGKIGINGAAAHLVKPGDKVIICAYAHMKPKKAKEWQPTVLLLDANNRVKEAKSSSGESVKRRAESAAHKPAKRPARAA